VTAWGLEQAERIRDGELPVRKLAREEAHTVGADTRGEELRVAQTGATGKEVGFWQWTPDGHLRHSILRIERR
jgi:hypothetical protein